MPHKLEAGFGLNKPSDGSLGLGGGTAFGAAGSPVPASKVNPIAANVPAPSGGGNRNLKDIAASALLGFQGDPGQAVATVQGAQQRRAQAKQLEKQNAIRSIQLGVSLATSANALPFSQRAAFSEATGLKLQEADPIAADIFKQFSANPANAAVFEDLLDFPVVAQTLNTGGPAAVVELLKTPAGIEIQNQAVDQKITPAAFSKIQQITGSLDKLVRDKQINADLVKRVQADGKVSVAELREIAESMPDNHPMKLNPGELTAATSERNLGNLRAVGISLAEDFEPEDLKLQAQDNIVDSKGEFVGLGVFDPKKGFMVQTDKGLRPLKKGERTVATSGSLADTGLTKNVTTELQNQLLASADASDRLFETIDKFDTEFLTIAGKVKFGALAMAESAGINLSDEMKSDLARFTQFKAGALDNLNRYIKLITGAAMTKSEAERLRKTMPDPENDSPTEFLAKLQNVYDQTLVVRQRAMLAIEQGVAATTIPLSDIKAQIIDGSLPQQRLNALIDRGLTPDEAKDEIKKEFPADLLAEMLEKSRRRK